MASNKRKQILLVSEQMIGVKYSTVRGEQKQTTRQKFLKTIGLDKLVEQAGAIFLKLVGVKNDLKTELDTSSSYVYQRSFDDEYGGMYGIGGGNWNHQSSYSKPKEKFEIIDPDDPEETQWTYDDEDFLKAAVEAGLKIEKVTEDKKEITRVYLEKAVYKYEYPSKRSVQTCGFQGTKEYLIHMFGRNLHNADEDWYKACPLNEASGVPMHYASTVINDLVSPYHLGVSKVFVRKGLSTHTDAPDWMKSLGINPMAIGDHTIDNHMFIDRLIAMKDAAAEKAGKPLTEEDRQKMYDEMLKYADANYRFEYVDDAPKGSILLYAMGSKGTGQKAASYATGHGHTKFYPPRERGKETSWKLAIQLDHVDKLNYKVEPPFCPEPEMTKILVPWDSTVGEYTMKAFDKSSFSWEKRISDEKKKILEEEEKKTKKGKAKNDKETSHASTKSEVKVEKPEQSKK